MDTKKRAEELLPAAELAAMAVFSPLTERFPKMKDFHMETWDFCAAVGALSFATSAAMGRADGRRLLEAVSGTLDARYTAALSDCAGFSRRMLEAGMLPGTDPDAYHRTIVAKWIVWNTTGVEPSADDREFLAAIGALLAGKFESWWRDCPEPPAKRTSWWKV